MRRWLSAIALSACATAQAAPAQRVELACELQYNGSAIADINYLLEHDGRTYSLVERWKLRGILGLMGSAQRTSRGEIGTGGLRPHYYEDRRTAYPTGTARFDWEAKSLTLEFRRGPQKMPMPEHAQDRLSFLFTFAFDAPSKGPIAMKVIDGKGIADYVFDVMNRERIKTPVGEIEALRLNERTAKPGERNEVWLDPARSYLPVRVLVIQKDGTRLEQLAVRISPP